MGETQPHDAIADSDAAHFTTIGKALRRIQAQFEEAYLDDHKLVVDTGEYDQSYLNDLTPEQKRQLDSAEKQMRREERARKQEQRESNWWRGKTEKPKKKHKSPSDEPEMCVDPSEFPRIMDLLRARRHLDAAQADLVEAFDAQTPFLKKRKLEDMLGHLNDLDHSFGFTETDPETGTKVMKGPLVEYTMDGTIIAKALAEIGTTLNDHLGVKNQLANELKDDQLFGQFLR